MLVVEDQTFLAVSLRLTFVEIKGRVTFGPSDLGFFMVQVGVCVFPDTFLQLVRKPDVDVFVLVAILLLDLLTDLGQVNVSSHRIPNIQRQQLLPFSSSKSTASYFKNRVTCK